MLEDTGYGPSFRRRGSGNMLTHALMAVFGAALATGLLLAFYNPGSGSPDMSLPGSGAVPAPGSPSTSLSGGSGPDRSPQAQAQQEQQNGGFSGGSGGSPRCYTSNSGLTVPSAIAPVSSGTLIIGTICGSPAASAGRTGGAVITALNGQAVGSPDGLASILSTFHPGEVISVTWVSPSGQQTTSSLHLTAGPPQ